MSLMSSAFQMEVSRLEGTLKLSNPVWGESTSTSAGSPTWIVSYLQQTKHNRYLLTTQGSRSTHIISKIADPAKTLHKRTHTCTV